MTKCPFCGWPIPLGSPGCSNCGSLFDASILRTTSAEPPQKKQESHDPVTKTRPVRAFVVASVVGGLLGMLSYGAPEWNLYTASLLYFPPAAFAIAAITAAILLLVVLLVVGVPLRRLKILGLVPLLANGIALSIVLYCAAPLWLNSIAKGDIFGFLAAQIPQIAIVGVMLTVYWFVHLPRGSRDTGQSARLDRIPLGRRVSVLTIGPVLAAVATIAALYVPRNFDAQSTTLTRSYGHESLVTPLHMAVIGRDFERVKAFVAGGADVNASTDFGRTPLCFALIANESAMVGYLLDNGAASRSECYFRESREVQDRIPLLRYAVRQNSLVNVKALIAHGALDPGIPRQGPNSVEEALVKRNELRQHKGSSPGPVNGALEENLEILRVLLTAGVRIEHRAHWVKPTLDMFPDDRELHALFAELHRPATDASAPAGPDSAPAKNAAR